MKEEDKEQQGNKEKTQQKEEEGNKKWAKKKYKFEELVKQWDYSLTSKLHNRRVQIAKLKDGNYIILFKTLTNNIDKDRKKRIQILWFPIGKEAFDALFGLYFQMRTEKGELIEEAKEVLNGFKKQTSIFAKIETGNKEKGEQKVGMVRIKYTKNEEKEGEENV